MLGYDVCSDDSDEDMADGGDDVALVAAPASAHADLVEEEDKFFDAAPRTAHELLAPLVSRGVDFLGPARSGPVDMAATFEADRGDVAAATRIVHGERGRGDADAETRRPSQAAPALASLNVAADAVVTFVGVVEAFMEGERQLVVRGAAGAQAVVEDTALCLDDRRPLGCVAEVFGPVAEPFYLVRLADAADAATVAARVRRADSSPMHRGDAAAGDVDHPCRPSDESRRRRGRGRGGSVETVRCIAAAPWL